MEKCNQRENIQLPKKIKQSRLPFEVITTAVGGAMGVPKKRKLSQQSESAKNNKISRTEVENVNTENQTMPAIKDDTFKDHINLKDAPNDNIRNINQTEVSLNSSLVVEEEADNKSIILVTDDELDISELKDQSSMNSSHEESDSIEISRNASKTETSELDASMIFGADSQSMEPSKKRIKRHSTGISGKKLEEMEKRKQEKLQKRAEKEKQLQEVREAKRKEKEDARLLKKKEKQDEKKKKLKENDEKLKQKEDEKKKKQQELDDKIKQKEEEKLKKQELISAKLEEKKRKDEEKLKKLEEKKKADEEEERKKSKVKASFAKFFIPKEQLQSQPDENKCLFKPFEVMKGMTVASVVPDVVSSQFNRHTFDKLFISQDSIELYLFEIKSNKHKPLRNSKAKNPLDNDVMIVDESKEIFHQKGKLFQFEENVRPPYWGTWNKTSNSVKPRKPFAQDTAFFDYDVDSDEEWDEGGPGENLSDTENEKESEDDYEVDNEFFVPHGYLSADEDKDEEKIDSPEANQARLKMRELEFQEERKKKCFELKPKVIGCFWITDEKNHPEELSRLLKIHEAIVLSSVPIMTTSTLLVNEEGDSLISEKSPHEGKGSTKKTVPKEAMPYFIKLVHANLNKKSNLMKEFQEFWKQRTSNSVNNSEISEKNNVSNSEKEEKAEHHLLTPSNNSIKPIMYDISKRQMEKIISKIATWTRVSHPAITTYCWWVNEEVLKEYNCTDLPVPNEWNYVTHIETKLSVSPLQIEPEEKTPELLDKTAKPKSLCSTPSILKFAKRKSDLEKVSNKQDNIKCINDISPIPIVVTPVKSISGKNESSSSSKLNASASPISLDSVSKVKTDNHGTPSILKFLANNNKRRITPITIKKSNDIQKIDDENNALKTTEID